MVDFVPGVELAAGYYRDAVEPLIPVPHAAARIGWGSDVLGYDTERSTDHGWGPHVHVFVAADDVEPTRAAIDGRLPDEYRGWPTHFGWDAVAPRHWVEVMTVGQFARDRLGLDPLDGFDTPDWLVAPQQRLLEITRGAVFRDDDGELTRLRKLLDWYPDDVWCWMLACQWHRIAQEEPFVGRAAEVGDDLGSTLVAGGLVHDAMRLAFLVERRYAPYSKWFGTAFAELEIAPAIAASLRAALRAGGVAERAASLNEALGAIGSRFNALGLGEPLDPTPRLFHGRPFAVLDADRFTAAALAAVSDPALRSLPLIGAPDSA